MLAAEAFAAILLSLNALKGKCTLMVSALFSVINNLLWQT